MAGITQGEIDSIRDAQEDFLPDLATIKRKVFLGPDHWDSGNLATGVPARFTPGLFGILRQVAEKFTSLQSYTITVKWDQSIQDGDQVIKESTNEVFEVRFVRKSSSYQTVIQLVGELIS